MKLAKTMTKKKKIILAVFIAVAAVGAGLLYYFGLPGDSSSKVYVEKVADIVGLGSGNGTQNRYAGVVESQKEWNITQNVDKTVKEIYVKEGDTVKVGDKLFAYDNEEAKLNLAQAQLELERMENEIKAGEAEIKNLEEEKKSVAKSDQIEYTIQIQSQKATNKKTEYEIKSQKTKIESLEKAAKNSVVKSEMDGVVKKINQSVISQSDEVETYDDGSDESIFMSILATGDYRIRAAVNEQNQWSIEEGKEVIVRSRVDENAKWTGKITTVDTEKPESSSSNDYMDSGSEDMTTSSKYPFYVKLDSCEGLILGQHVYIEPDQGQDEEKEGLWLDAYYIVQEEEKSYVWAENRANHLEKREITLGEYDEELDKYEIVSGLTEEDYIAFPEEGMKAGLRTTRDMEEAFENEENVDEDGMGEEDMDVPEGEEELYQDFEGEDGILEEEIFEEEGTVGSIDQFREVLL